VVLALGKGGLVADFFADRDPRNLKLVACSVVGLDQHAHGEAACFVRQFSGSRARAAFELVADHPRASPDVALRHRPGLRVFQRRVDMPVLDVEAIAVV
jgi:hypothetical protein